MSSARRRKVNGEATLDLGRQAAVAAVTFTGDEVVLDA
jgi:hypothetical protein